MDKEQTAMERLRLASDMSLRLYHRPLLLTDSGGKDKSKYGAARRGQSGAAAKSNAAQIGTIA